MNADGWHDPTDNWTVLRGGPPFEPFVESGHSSDPRHALPSGILSVPRTMSEDDFQCLERRWRWAVKAQGNALRILNPDGSHGGWFGRRPPWWKRAYCRARMFLARWA